MFRILPKSPLKSGVMITLLWKFGKKQLARGNTAEALRFYRQALAMHHQKDNNLWSLSAIFSLMSEALQKAEQADSSLHYAHMALSTSLLLKIIKIDRISGRMAELYKAWGILDSAYYYQKMSSRAVSARYGPEKVRQLQRLVLEEQQGQQAQAATQKAYEGRVRLSILLAGLGVVLLVDFLLYRPPPGERLAYQGIRAKYESFQRELITDFAPNLGKVEVVAPNIWRVLLNLYNKNSASASSFGLFCLHV